MIYFVFMFLVIGQYAQKSQIRNRMDPSVGGGGISRNLFGSTVLGYITYYSYIRSMICFVWYTRGTALRTAGTNSSKGTNSRNLQQSRGPFCFRDWVGLGCTAVLHEYTAVCCMCTSIKWHIWISFLLYISIVLCSVDTHKPNSIWFCSTRQDRKGQEEEQHNTQAGGVWVEDFELRDQLTNTAVCVASGNSWKKKTYREI